MTVPLSLVIDTDTASDDAVALLMAARSPHATIRAVTTVAGNVPLAMATRNALVTLELAGARDVPVYEGLAHPLLRSLGTAQDVHGNDGMSGVEFADPTMTVDGEHAVDALRRIARDEPGRHTLVTLGPLSTIATALLADPLLMTRFRRVYLMAGAFDGVGNVHAVGEFNVWADPEAASIVLAAEGDKTFVGWDMSWRYAVMNPDEQRALRAVGPLGEFAVGINRCVDEFAREHSGLVGLDLPDPIAMAVALDPSIATTEAVTVTIGVDDISRGGTFVDRRFPRSAPNANIVLTVDEARFKAMLTAACSA
ncbi:MAG: nucleoside hydrolase [Ilumatobacteraceae bacterium]